MKHDWGCLKEPYVDKVVDWAIAAKFRDSNRVLAAANGLGKSGWWPKSAKVLKERPGWFYCRACGYVFEGNYAPPEDWISVGIIPDCMTEVARKVQES